MRQMSEEEWRIVDKIPGAMDREACEWLYTTASGVRSWTEVGCKHGRSLVATGLGLDRGGLLQAVDRTFDTQFWDSILFLRSRRPDLIIVVCPCDSVKAARVLPNTDVVFIDANHSYGSVNDDIVAWRGKCRILCGHDYMPGPAEFAGVCRAVDENYPGRTLPASSIWVA